MLVKELIEYLKTQNPEDYVGVYDYSQDTGDWMELDVRRVFDNDCNFSVKSEDEIVKLYDEGKAELSNKTLQKLINAGKV